MKIFILLLLTLSLWANIGNIMAIKGSADVKRAGETLDAKNGMVLEKGDTILTIQKSRVQVMLNDETVVTIGSNSSFSFEEYFFNDTKKSKLTMRANRGFFRSVTGKIGKLAPERFKVKTASATIGIRGTDFSGNILVDSEVFKCYQGEIFIEFEGQEQALTAGMMVEIFKDKDNVKKLNTPKILEKVSKIDDTDNESTDTSTDDSNDNATESTESTEVSSLDSSDISSEIPSEVISDITQIADNPEESSDGLSVDTEAEDRQQQY